MTVSGKLYRAARAAGDIEAASRGPSAYARRRARRARRAVWRVTARSLRRVFRSAGL